MHAARRRGKGRSRILYWFRTPPGVRVGRGPLDEEAIRTIEAGNPDLDFDWTRILKGQAEPADEPREGSERSDRRGPDRPERRERPRGRDSRMSSSKEPAGFAKPDAVANPSPAAPAELEVAGPTPAAHAKLGSEGLARLRARYSETLARVADRVPDPDRQEQLKALAERLNPDAWVTDSDVSAGLESYEAVFAELRNAIPSSRGSRASTGTSGVGDAGEPPV